VVIQEDTPGNKKIFIDKCLIHAYVSIKKRRVDKLGISFLVSYFGNSTSVSQFFGSITTASDFVLIRNCCHYIMWIKHNVLYQYRK